MDSPQTKNRLLLVDGDPKSLRVLDVSLKKAGFEVTTASSGREALATLDAEVPDLIISDTDLEEMDGFDLCRRIKAKPEWAKIPFLFVSGRKSIEDKIRGLELGVDDYLTKPIYIKEIGIRVRTALQRAERERMESRREGRTRFAGALSDVGVVDLVQTIELNRKSGIIHIVNRDERRGSIFFRDGKVIDAEVGRLSGAFALYRLFAWSEGQFAVEFKHIRRHDVIDTSMAALLMEGMRRLDEGARLLEQMPPTSSVLEVDCRVLAEELAELPDEMNSVLRLCDGARTLQEVVEESDLPDLESLGVIAKLFQDQIIFAREAPARGGEAEPGARLANWLSEGDSEEAEAVRELRSSLDIEPRGQATPSPDVLQDKEIVPQADKILSAEETLGAALPSRVDETIGESVEMVRPPDTLRGVPVEGLFPEGDGKPAEARAAQLPGGAAVPTEVASESSRPTKPMGLAERLLSGDSVVRATAMHEAHVDEPTSADKPPSGERRTHPYGDPAAALVQEVVAATHTSTAPLVTPPEPARPVKEVDWGAWPAVATPATPAASPRTPSPSPKPVVPSLVHEPPKSESQAKVADAKSSSAELDTADLEDVEPAEPQSAKVSPASSSAPALPAEPPTRLGPEDVLPLEGDAQPPDAKPADVPPSGTATGSDARPTSASEERSPSQLGPAEESTAVVQPPEPPSFARHLWLLGLAALALGLIGFLALRGSGPEMQEATPPPAPPPVTASPIPQPVSIPSRPLEPGGSATASPTAAQPPSAPRAEAAAIATAKPQATKPAESETASAPAPVEPRELRQKCLEADAEGKGKAKAVVKACRPALEAEPQSVEIMVILARAEIDRGRLGEARSLARKALAADPARAEAYVYLGTAEQEAGRPDEARAAYKKYLELAPEGRFAREIRAILNNL